MRTPIITALYGSALALLFVLLAVRVALSRWRSENYIGEHDRALKRFVRAHANFSETIPLCLLLLAFSEMLGAGANFLHAMGSSLLVARIVHAYGVSRDPEPIWFRVVGFTVSSAVLVIASLSIVYLWLAG